MGKSRLVIDKDGEDFLIYQIDLKQYPGNSNKFNGDLKKCYSLLIGQCSPTMEQIVSGDKDFKAIKEKSDSIGLLKLIEKICDNYQYHEFATLGG